MLMEQNDSITEGQVASVHEYTIANEELEKEKEILQISLESNRGELAEVREKIDASEGQKEDLRMKLLDLRLKKEEQEGRVKGEEENKKHKKEELEIIKAQFDKARQDESEMREARHHMNAQYKDLKNQAYELEILVEKERKYYAKLEKEESV